LFKKVLYFDTDCLQIGQAIEIWASKKAAQDLFHGNEYIHAIIVHVDTTEITIRAYVNAKKPMSLEPYEWIEQKIGIEAVRNGLIRMRELEWNDDEDLYPDDDEEDDDEEYPRKLPRGPKAR
jgi:hypothetical protein